MQKSNYALISALYGSSNKGLYSDIYFPIIKYSIVKIFKKSNTDHPFCSADAVHDFILDRFGLLIPSIVIAKSVVKLSEQKDNSINIKVFEKGGSFQIQSASLEFYDRDVDQKEIDFNNKLAIIENEYKSFINREGTIDDSISFVQFITDNTEDILGYFEHQDKNVVDEKYATMIFFLQYLSDNNQELYFVANQLFWSSIIVGFLLSDKPVISESDNGVKTEYFLDTSIVMGLLELSTPQRQNNAKEVCELIKRTDGILRVNPMTVDEISFILKSVEQHGPNPLTDIASAYDNRKLNANLLAEIRLNLAEKIEQLGVNVFPNLSPNEKQGIVESFRGKRTVKLLAEDRNKRPASYSNDNYREIHDIYMDNYIKQRRASKNDPEHVFFLTANNDLIAFCKEMHRGSNYMKSLSQVILELWMHNSKSVDISSCALTETMARCLDLHSSQVRLKIAEVSRYYNQTKDNFNPEIYRDFIKSLYRRAKNVINAVETDFDQRSHGESFVKLIEEAVAADNLYYNQEAERVRKDNEALSETLQTKDRELEIKTAEMSTLEEEKKRQQDSINELEKEKQTLLSNLKQRDEMIEQALAEKKNAERKSKLLQERDDIQKSRAKVLDDLSVFEASMKKSFTNWQPRVFYVLGGLLAIIVLILVYCYINETYLPVKMIRKLPVIISVFAIFGTSFFIFGHTYSAKERVEKRRNNAYEKWSKNPNNLRYNELKEELSKYTSRLEEIDNELKK